MAILWLGAIGGVRRRLAACGLTATLTATPADGGGPWRPIRPSDSPPLIRWRTSGGNRGQRTSESPLPDVPPRIPYPARAFAAAGPSDDSIDASRPRAAI